MDECHPRRARRADLDGKAKTDDQADKAMGRICRRAGLPVFLFHRLRHTFGTHAALFGVNPWRLQAWLGHKRIDETMLYVHVAEAHRIGCAVAKFATRLCSGPRAFAMGASVLLLVAVFHRRDELAGYVTDLDELGRE